MPTKVLLVEGDETPRLSLAQVLKELKIWCALAADEAQALSRLKEHDFELAVIDINLTGKPSLDLLRYVRSEFPTVATLVLSSVDDPQVIDAALEAGAYTYLVKPLRTKELFIQVSCALRRRTAEIKLRNRVERLKTALLEQTNAVLNARQRVVLLEERLQASSGPPNRTSSATPKP